MILTKVILGCEHEGCTVRIECEARVDGGGAIVGVDVPKEWSFETMLRPYTHCPEHHADGDWIRERHARRR